MKKKGKGGWFKKYQGGHYTGDQKCGQEHYSTSSHKPSADVRKDVAKTGKRGTNMSY